MGVADLCRGQRRSPPAVSGREVPVPLAASSSAGIPAASPGLFFGELPLSALLQGFQVV